VTLDGVRVQEIFGGIDETIAEHDASPGSDDIWLAVIGPDTPDEGEVRTAGTLYQGQVAATMLQFLGLDPSEFVADALPPVAGALQTSK
jgi:hypothetical protein